MTDPVEAIEREQAEVDEAVRCHEAVDGRRDEGGGIVHGDTQPTLHHVLAEEMHGEPSHRRDGDHGAKPEGGEFIESTVHRVTANSNLMTLWRWGYDAAHVCATPLHTADYLPSHYKSTAKLKVEG